MMKRASVVLAVAAWSVTALAADMPAAAPGGNLIRTVARMESAYGPGEVVAIALDDAGDKPAHYHVDMSFAHSGVARLDVDAMTGEISGRDHGIVGTGWASLADAASLAGRELGGQVVGAELDGAHGALVHYDVDVQMPSGDIARLKVDPVTRQLGWRTPAVIAR